MIIDKEILKVRKKCVKKQKKYIIMNQEKMDETAFMKKHGHASQDAEWFKKLREKNKQ